MNFYTKIVELIKSNYSKVIASIINIFNMIRVRKVAYLIYALVAFVLLFFVQLLIVEYNVKKSNENQEMILETLESLDAEINKTQVLILESEVERLKITNNVISNDAEYQLRMNGYKDRINELKRKYNYENDEYNFNFLLD